MNTGVLLPTNIEYQEIHFSRAFWRRNYTILRKWFDRLTTLSTVEGLIS